MKDESEYLNITETAVALGVNRRRVWQMVRADELESLQNPLDRRETLIPRTEVDRLAKFARKKAVAQ